MRLNQINENLLNCQIIVADTTYESGRTNMKILLILPWSSSQLTSTALQSLTLNYIAAVTPADHSVEIIDENREAIDFSSDCDLVGISAMTSTAPRAYEIAAKFRDQGKTVALGGIHPTLLPEEAAQFADAVVIGEAELVWKQLLSDFAAARLKRFYQADNYADLSKIPLPRRDLTEKYRKGVHIATFQTTRGCPFKCPFCVAQSAFGKKMRHMPVEMVVEDIKKSKNRNVSFHDDNIIGDPHYAQNLFEALIPLKIRWAAQASLSITKHKDLLSLARKSGCRLLFVGLESVSSNHNLTKNPTSPKEIREAINKFHQHKILFHASVIFGFDFDECDVFKQTVRLLKDTNISSCEFHILTPYPKTPIFEKFKREKRLFTEEWQYYENNFLVFKPSQMKPEDLILGWYESFRRFYSIGSILNRFRYNLFSPFLYSLSNVGMILPRMIHILKDVSSKQLEQVKQWSMNLEP